MLNTNLTLNSDVDVPVVEVSMVDDGLSVGLFILDVEDSAYRTYCHAEVLRPSDLAFCRYLHLCIPVLPSEVYFTSVLVCWLT